MSDSLKGQGQAHNNDLESGGYGEEEASGPFDIVRTKSASVDRLKRWRVGHLSYTFFSNNAHCMRFEMMICYVNFKF